MAIDPTAQFILTTLEKQGVKSFEHCTIEEARAVMDTFPQLQNPPEEVRSVEDIDRNGVAMRVYTPANANGSGILYVHGGGFIGGHLGVCDEPARALANETGAVVFATTYRLAPEAKFPAQPDDVFASLQWSLANADKYGVDPQRFALVGDSAGGNLATVNAIRARDAGITLAAQALVYPVIDRRLKVESKTRCAEGYLISAAALEWFWNHYLSKPSDIESPLASPLNAKSLAGLAPTLILTAEYDPSGDEAVEYFKALKAAGNDAVHVPLLGLIHGAFWMSGAIPRSCEVLAAISQFLAPRLAKRN